MKIALKESKKLESGQIYTEFGEFIRVTLQNPWHEH